MLTKKQRRELLEKPPPRDWNFDYVKDLAPHLQRMAVFWEYARESTQIIELIKAACDAGKRSSEDDKRVILRRAFQIMKPDEFFLLVAASFPNLSFEAYRSQK